MPSPHQPKSAIPALSLIAAIAAVVVLVFAWTAGFLTPRRIGGATIIDAVQYSVGKVYPGFRRAHTKGLCVTGHFDANGAGTAYSSAPLFPAGRLPVMGRFSTNAGVPMSPDEKAVFHAFALRFVFPDRQEWRMAMDQTPIFIVSTPAAFVALQIATKPDPATGKPDPATMKAYLAAHPETQRFFDYLKNTPMPSSFANGTYHSISAFRFVPAQGATQFVRWQFEPETPFAALDAKAQLPESFLFDDLWRRLKSGPLKWHLVLIPANPGDVTDNATVEWVGPHKRVDAGTLVIDGVQTEAEGNCRGFNFDPTILPSGVALSDDPLPPARSAAYAASFRRRAIEGPHPDPLSGQIEGQLQKGALK